MNEDVSRLWNTIVLFVMGILALAWTVAWVPVNSFVACLSAPIVFFVQFRLTLIALGKA